MASKRSKKTHNTSSYIRQHHWTTVVIFVSSLLLIITLLAANFQHTTDSSASMYGASPRSKKCGETCKISLECVTGAYCDRVAKICKSSTLLDPNCSTSVDQSKAGLCTPCSEKLDSLKCQEGLTCAPDYTYDQGTWFACRCTPNSNHPDCMAARAGRFVPPTPRAPGDYIPGPNCWVLPTPPLHP